ncbi:MAG: putative transport system, permease component [Verrucomicrobiales bacterium]|nr:putative transport system, permease component [Verrucomicrobiales bacterium]
MNNVFALAVVVIKELYRRKDFYVLFILTALITLLLGSINFFDDDKIVRFIKEIDMNLIWLSSLVIAVTTTARQIPSERENRTIFPLLAKPVSRCEVLLGKFFGCWLACGLCLVVFYLFFAVISGAKDHSLDVGSYLEGFWLHWVCLAVVISFVLWGSIVFAAPSSNSTISLVLVLGILFVAQHLKKVSLQLSEPGSTILSAIYYSVPHLEFFFNVRSLVIHGLPMPSIIDIFLATLYGGAYGAFFFLAAWLSFRNKSLA